MRGLSRRLAGLWGFIALLTVVAHAAESVPPPLEPWRGWVMRSQEFRACPLIAGHQATAIADYVCAWPGTLDVRADDRGADIAQHWRVEAESWIPLPGDGSYWPQDVSVDGQPAPVIEHDGPALRLAPGAHVVRLHIPWAERPQTLRVPDVAGLVALTVDGKPVSPMQRISEALTLGRAKSETPEADSLEVRVYRKLADGVPALLTTQIQLYASGQAREVTIGPALPDGFAPVSLESREWPAKLDADGKLRVLAQPGDDTITLEARALAPLATAVARVPDTPWPTQEIWSYQAASNERVTTAESAIRVDPRQAFAPDEWRELPAFALGDGATLSITERSRGLAPDEKNRLSLDREMWLDFSGDGWFARDRVTGEMLRGWRFDVAPPYKLERADARNSTFAFSDSTGDGERLLVTRGEAKGRTGVEWRTPAVDLGAGVRVDAANALPVTGWQDSFDRVTTTLHLPNGYKLLGAIGADSAGGSWIAEWTLLDVFVTAIVALLAWRLVGFAGALLAIGYLALAYQEPDAPIWTLLIAFALGLIARALQAGRLATIAIWTRRAALVLLVVVAVPFVASELRYALHPQLERGGETYAGFADGLVGGKKSAMPQRAMAPPAAPPPPAEAPRDRSQSEDNQRLETIAVTGSNIRRGDVLARYTESTVLQTGAGEPSWNVGPHYVLSWAGPVLPAQDVRFVIAPPWLVRLLRIVLVALLAALIVRLVRGAFVTPPRAAAAAIGSALFASLFVYTPTASAQAYPPQDFLNELRSVLTQPPECVPVCATIAKATVAARGDEIRVALEAHAAARVAMPVPGETEGLALRSTSVDGAAQDGLARGGTALLVALARGVHRIELVYSASAERVAIRFPLRPMRVEVATDGWQSGGVAENRLLTESLALTRLRESPDSVPNGGAQAFAPFVRVTRNLTFDLDWAIQTSIERIAPKEGGITVAVPLLPGEHVLTQEARVEEGARVVAAISDADAGMSWNSTLDKSATLTLTAPPLSDRAEVWTVLASPLWHVEASGVPVVVEATPHDADDFRRLEFRPLPGETLTVRIDKPEAAAGATRAIDRASLVVAAGKRASDATLDLSVRASQGGDHAITLPADAEVMNVLRNGEVLNLRPRDGKLSLPLVPGTQAFEVRFRTPTAAGFITRTPEVALGLPAANITLGVDLPADRWLLATSGPPEGPAVLYWSELVAMVLVAWALARTRRTPLGFVQWVLLGIGFSTFSWIALAFVVAWLFAFDARRRYAPLKSVVLFDLAQIGLALLTLVALLCLVAAIPQGLLGSPDMHVAGNGSTAQGLRWFADRSADALPGAAAVSVPLWIYKIAMLAWAIWLANAVIGWVRYAFAAWAEGGYWRSRPRPVVDIPNAAAPPPAP
jgi:hypothetical protein